MTTHSEREAFEATYHAEWGDEINLDRRENGKYYATSHEIAWRMWQAARVDLPPHPTEVGEAVSYEVISHFASGAYGTKMPIIGIKDGEHIPVGTKLYSAQGLHVYAAPAAVDGKTQEYTLRAMAMNYSGGHSWDHLDSDACRNGADEIASLRALLATANSAEGKVVPGAVIIDAMEHLPDNRAATRQEMVRAFALSLNAAAREKMVVDEELTKDAARWRYLVAENNKGGLHGKYLICWYDPKGDGYCSTNGLSVNGKDDQAIVRIIDAAMLRAYAEVVDGWRPIETAPEGVEVIVYWQEDGEGRFAFDAIDKDEGVWIEHSNNYEHYLSAAPPGSRGPSEKPPYTHWKALTPPLTAALSTRGGGETS